MKTPLPVAAIGIVLLQLTWTGFVRGIHFHPACGSNRCTGDKWFDGCRWCVCYPNGPVCSTEHCSSLVSLLPRCSNLGSRWRDGSYLCTCSKSGITCEPDKDLVHHLRHEVPGWEDETQSTCTSISDGRCVCDIDGIQLCSAEARDENSNKKNRITITINMRPGHHAGSSLPGNSMHRKHDVRKGPHSQQADEPQPALEYVISPNKKIRFSSDDILDPQRSDEDVIPHNVFDPSKLKQWLTNGIRGDQPSQPTRVEHPKPVRASHNRCEFADRWYTGSMRCRCFDARAKVTCGEPSSVTAISFIRLVNWECQKGATFELNYCLICHCQFSGFPLCSRSGEESCSATSPIQHLLNYNVNGRNNPSFPKSHEEMADEADVPISPTDITYPTMDPDVQ